MSINLTALIVEDEAASRITLSNYLTKYCPNVSVIGEAENINEAYQFIKLKSPDLVFLDVEMPFGNAFDLLEKFESIDFEVVFVTAFSKYAIDAIQLSASNYLLKPLSIDDLITAVEKVTENVANKQQLRSSSILLENLNIENKQLKKLVLPVMDGFEVVVLKDVVWCEANDNLTVFHLIDGTKKTVCKTLKFYEEALSNYDFIRVHKSYIININYVKKYKKGKGGQVTLTNDKVINVSVNRKQSFLNLFG